MPPELIEVRGEWVSETDFRGMVEDINWRKHYNMQATEWIKRSLKLTENRADMEGWFENC